MYIGIYINDSHLYAGMLNQDDEVVPINGTGLITDFRSSATELKIYIEDDFAYVGMPVNHLIANNYELNCAKYFLDSLQHPEKTVYTNPTGVLWNAPSLLAIFLKKLKGDISIHNEEKIRGAMVTTTAAVTPELTEALQLAFKMADMPFAGVVDMGKVVWHGSGIVDSFLMDKKWLVFNLDQRAVTIGMVSVDKENFAETLLLKSDEALGENSLHDGIIHFLATTYGQMTGKKIKKSAKNAIALKKMAKEILLDYFAQSNLYIRTVYYMTEPAIELILTRAQLNAIVSKYMQQSISFLKEALATTGFIPDDIGEVVLTGESKLLQIVPLALRPLFDSKKTRIHYQNPAEILPKGITLLANDDAEREISTSLLAATDVKLQSDEKHETAFKIAGEDQDPNQLLQLIRCMQINKTGDM